MVVRYDVVVIDGNDIEIRGVVEIFASNWTSVGDVFVVIFVNPFVDAQSSPKDSSKYQKDNSMISVE